MKPFLEFLAKFFGSKDRHSSAIYSDASEPPLLEEGKEPGPSVHSPEIASASPQSTLGHGGRAQGENLRIEEADLVNPLTNTPLRSRKDTLHEVLRIEFVPALHTASEDLRKVLARSGVYLEEIVAAISRDPLLSLGTLRVANSLLSQESARICDIDVAVQMLGAIRLGRMVEGYLEVQRELNSLPSLDLRPLWIHSLAVGLIAEELSRRLRYGNPRHLYFAGLWHDAGKMVLSHAFPESYSDVLGLAFSEESGLEELEMQYFGVTHSEVGMIYAEQCGAGPLATQAIGHHATPEIAKLNRGGAAIVSISNHLANAQGIGFGGLLRIPSDDPIVLLSGLSAWTVLMAETGRKEDVPELHRALQPFLESLVSNLESIRRSL